MPARHNKRIDGSRRRCQSCGHPQAEHRVMHACTVPRCPCDEYQPSSSTVRPATTSEPGEVSPR
jgi:hypothetical protein